MAPKTQATSYDGSGTVSGGGSATGSGGGVAAPTESRSPIGSTPDIFDAAQFDVNSQTIKAFFSGLLKGFFSDGAGGIWDGIKGIGSFIGGYAEFTWGYWSGGPDSDWSSPRKVDSESVVGSGGFVSACGLRCKRLVVLVSSL